jgi:hypothetical protein
MAGVAKSRNKVICSPVLLLLTILSQYAKSLRRPVCLSSHTASGRTAVYIQIIDSAPFVKPLSTISRIYAKSQQLRLDRAATG